ncbi:nucleobase:cation symporter-2 family protein [Aciduricibacillus chroicocephali]|uniref:Nucleobase:cation symporter-2 family protein n=1 Tax=Aciduricibacillus chroicocephali TaxID=3054939 RepID=A0ABY9KXS5_9BACI|nr:nucleobase:cation symporter-2 family protein [Bacillaceae bacterium 44XB]
MGKNNLNKKDVINEKLPVQTLGILGFQHVLVMYSGAVIVPLILGAAINLSAADIAFLISADLFTCGIATLLQVVGFGKFIGIRLPIIMGAAVITLPAMIMVAGSEGLPAMYGAILISGTFIFFLSFFVVKLIKFFPKLVSGCLVTIVGLSLTPIALQDMAGGQGSPSFGEPKNYLLATFVLLIILLVNKFFKGFFKAIAILIGLIVGTIIGGFMGMVDLTAVGDSPWFRVITPFYFGMPKFTLTGALTMSIFATVAIVESVGMYRLVEDLCETKISTKDISKGVRAEGIAQVLGAVFNGFPYVTFSENAGIMTITGVRSRYVVISASLFLIILGVIPKFSALATIVPSPVLGGAMLALFGMIGATGVKMIGEVDLSNTNNLLVVACSIGSGLGVEAVPGLFSKMPEIIETLLGNGIFTGTFIAILLNLLFNYREIFSKSFPTNSKIVQSTDS